ncbi:hypothetical protein CC79DRAFT_1330263 [Sarocladium strictum]
MASGSDPPTTKQEICISDQDFNIIGFDCIWHNMDCDSDFTVFRSWYYIEMDKFLVLIADRLRHKVFTVLSLNATKHMVVITIATKKNSAELLEKWFDEDYWVGKEDVGS